SVWPYIKLLRPHIDRRHALQVYWSWNSIQEMYRKAQQVRADIWIANDWSTLPIAARLAEEKGGVYLYDSPEFGTQERPNHWKWGAFTQPIAKAAEARYIHMARQCFAVSPGIASALTKMYRLHSPVEVLRNMPLRQSPHFRPTGEKI